MARLPTGTQGHLLRNVRARDWPEGRYCMRFRPLRHGAWVGLDNPCTQNSISQCTSSPERYFRSLWSMVSSTARGQRTSLIRDCYSEAERDRGLSLINSNLAGAAAQSRPPDPDASHRSSNFAGRILTKSQLSNFPGSQLSWFTDLRVFRIPWEVLNDNRDNREPLKSCCIFWL